MANRRVIETYYGDINNLTTVLTQLVNSYRLLIGGADDLNKIALSSKSDVKDALKRADKLGDIIDKLIDTLDETSYQYCSYCKIKTAIIEEKVEAQFVATEIEQELYFAE